MLEKIELLMAEKAEDLSESTRRNYRHCLLYFASYVQEQGIDPAEIQKVQILNWLNSHKWSQSMKHNAVCALKLYYRRFHDLSQLEGIRIKRPRPRPQRTLYVEEVEQLLSSIETRTDLGIRDMSILTLMIDTGMRANELCSLHADHVDPDRRTVDLKIKGGDWHRSVFGVYAGEWLKAWIFVRLNHAGTGVPFLYVGIGGSTPGQKLTVTGLRANFYRLSRKAGIPKFSPHALRRTFATLSTRYGVPKRIIQANGGWQTSEMVDRYTMQISAEDFTTFPTDRIMGLGFGDEPAKS